MSSLPCKLSKDLYPFHVVGVISVKDTLLEKYGDQVLLCVSDERYFVISFEGTIEVSYLENQDEIDLADVLVGANDFGYFQHNSNVFEFCKIDPQSVKEAIKTKKVEEIKGVYHKCEIDHGENWKFVISGDLILFFNKNDIITYSFGKSKVIGKTTIISDGLKKISNTRFLIPIPNKNNCFLRINDMLEISILRIIDFFDYAYYMDVINTPYSISDTGSFFICENNLILISDEHSHLNKIRCFNISSLIDTLK